MSHKSIGLKEIKRLYQEARKMKARWERLQLLYKELYLTRRKMLILAKSEKYGHLMKMECDEKFGDGEASLAFCIERCVIKCPSFDIVQKRRPKLLKYVGSLNAKYFKTLEKIEETKRLT